jgi:hypothetical protein
VLSEDATVDVANQRLFDDLRGHGGAVYRSHASDEGACLGIACERRREVAVSVSLL